MKKRNILLTGLLLMALSACNDFLDVETVSKFDNKYIFSDKSEMNRALNGVYAQLLSGDLYGSAYMGIFCLNSDVDMSTSTSEYGTTNSYRRFDCESSGSDVNKIWTAAYRGVEYANNFIYNLEHSELFSIEDAEMMQMLGEAKAMRAMIYHDLIVMFGDVPFSLMPTYESGEFLYPVSNREEIHKSLIDDLKSIAPYMQFAKDMTAGVERASKEFCWSLIARMALTCGGYSLQPDVADANNYGTMKRLANYRDYYEITRQYCDSVISSGTHSLTLPFRQVFIDECNYIVNSNDDPIFEIPFAKKSNGSVGHLQGPTGENYEGLTSGKNVWGKSSGSARLNAFYRFSFDGEDLRRDYVNGMWYYQFDGTPVVRNDLTVHNNKWSKFWQNSANTMGVDSDNNTGINYPYMRYADVLLMYAEAVNELENGVGGANGVKGLAAFRQVRSRAFANAGKVDTYIASVSGTKEDFLKAILDERKWEFSGENMRWKDLVRNNMYSEVVYYSFLRYYAVAESGGSGYSSYIDPVEEYDGKSYLWTLPRQFYFRVVTNPNNINTYPNTSLDVLEVYNPYQDLLPGTPYPTGYESANFYAWWTENPGCPRNECLYSFYGFIRGDQAGSIFLINNGTKTAMGEVNHTNLPPVRYILPYPNAAIQRGAGEYKNYYGYTN